MTAIKKTPYDHVCEADNAVDLLYASRWVKELNIGVQTPEKPDWRAIASAIGTAIEADQRLAQYAFRSGDEKNGRSLLARILTSRDGKWICMRLGHKEQNRISINSVTLERLPELVADLVCGCGVPHDNSVKLLRECLDYILSRTSLGLLPTAGLAFHRNCLEQLSKTLGKILYNAVRRQAETSSTEASLRTVIDWSQDKVCNSIAFLPKSGAGKLSTRACPFPYPNYLEVVSKDEGREEPSLFRPHDVDAAGKLGPIANSSGKLVRHYVAQRNIDADHASSAQADIQTLLPPKPLEELDHLFIEYNLFEQANMKEMLGTFVKKALQKNSWITRKALTSAIHTRFGDKINIPIIVTEETERNRRISEMMERPPETVEDSQVDSDSSETVDPASFEALLADATFNVLYDLKWPQELDKILHKFWSTEGLSGKGRLSEIAMEFYQNELREAPKDIRWQSREISESATENALRSIYRETANADQRNVLENARREEVLAPTLVRINQGVLRSLLANSLNS